MQLSQLMYFVTVAEQGSINKAAEKLFVTQPNLSKAIGNLESELKVRIFDRTNKGVILTEDGKKLYEYARTILNPDGTDFRAFRKGTAAYSFHRILSDYHYG